MPLMRQKSTGKIFNIERGQVTEVDPRVAETDIPQQVLAGFAGSLGLNEPGGIAQDLADVNPIATNVGRFGLDVAGVGGGAVLAGKAAIAPFKRAATERAARVAESVRAGVAAREGVKERAAAGVAGGIPASGAITEQMQRQALDQGLKSVGAAERSSTLQSIKELFTSPAPLTDAQLKAIPEAERLGFMFVPGQTQGSRLLTEGIKTDPILRDAVEQELSHNRDRLQTLASQSLGIGDQPMDADALGLAAETIGAKFDAVREGIEAVTVGPRLADDIGKLLTTRQKASMGFDDLAEGADLELDGKAAMEIRSRLNSIMSDEWRAGRGVVAEDIGELIEELDEFILPRLSPELRAEWRQAKEQWRFLRVLESGKVTSPETGIVNISSLNTALKKNFKSEFGRQQFGPRTTISTEGSDFMDFARVGAAFKDSIGDSGTAGRNRAIQLLTNPKEAAMSFLARKFIEREADRLNLATPP